MAVDTTPEAHSATALPSVIDGTADDDARALNYSPRESRSWRAVEYATTAPGPATEDQDGAAIGPHVGQGSPDPRAVWGGTAGHTGPTDPELNPKGEQTANIRDLENIHNQAPIDRPRAGSIGTDETRSSWMPKWLYLTPFDQWAQYGPAAHPKIEQASPLASRPLAYTGDLVGALPSAGGSGATTKEGVDIQANTVRYLPQPHDATLVTANTDTSVHYDAAIRSRGWGLR